MRSRIFLAVFVVLSARASAAQTFTSSKLQPGATIEVKPMNARPARGTLTSGTPTLIRINENGIARTFAAAGIARVDVIGDDTLWNGIQQGYKVSMPYWFIGSGLAAPCNHKAYEVFCLIGFQLASGAPFAAAGAVADALHDGRTTVFRSDADAAASQRQQDYRLYGTLIGAGIGAALGSRLCGDWDGCNIHDRITSAIWLAELFAMIGRFIGGHAGGTAGTATSPRDAPPPQIQFGFSF